jgi:DNA mismatch endonuclease (patch repair protein)
MNKAKEYIRDGRAPIPEKEATSRMMSAIKDRDTKPELLLRKALWQEGIRGYRLHWEKVPGRPDIAFPKRRVAIFVNGCFWHRCPYCKPAMPRSHSNFWKEKFKKNIARDKKKIELLQGQKWKVLVIWECEVKTDLMGCVNRIRKTISLKRK